MLQRPELRSRSRKTCEDLSIANWHVVIGVSVVEANQTRSLPINSLRDIKRSSSPKGYWSQFTVHVCHTAGLILFIAYMSEFFPLMS